MKNSFNWLNKKLFFGFIFLVALLALIDWVIFGNTPADEMEKVRAAVTKKINPGGFYGAAKEHAATSSLAIQQAVEKFSAQGATAEEFKKWFEDEVSLMSQFNVNEEAYRDRYLQITAKMTPEQFKILAEKAATKTTNASEKMLAAYLLGYAGYESATDLASFAASDIQLDGAPNPHSAAETQATQERAIRVLAINRLADLARGDDGSAANAARVELEKLISRIKDPSLKNYAQNKIKELSK
jgi:hypothetical protein